MGKRIGSNKTRRLAIGNMLMDVSKYVFTAVVISGLVSERVVWRMVIMGLIMVFLLGAVGFWVIPQDKEKEVN